MSDFDADFAAPQLPGGVIVPPPRFQFVDFPATTAVVAVSLGAIALMLLSSRFDNTAGALTISLLIILAFVGVLAYSVTVTVPEGRNYCRCYWCPYCWFRGVVTYWFKKQRFKWQVISRAFACRR